MNIFLLFAYISGVALVVLAFFSFLFPNIKSTLLIKLTIDIITLTNSVSIFLYERDTIFISLMITCFISILRDVVYFKKEKYPLLEREFIPFIFLTLLICPMRLANINILSLLPLLGSVISTISLFSNRLITTKIGGLCCYVLYIVYYSFALNESDILTIFPLLSGIIGLLGTLLGLNILTNKMKKYKHSL